MLTVLLSALIFGLSINAEAQQPAKTPRIGFLSSLSPDVVSDRLEAFRHGLTDLGYIERKNIFI